MNYQLNNKNLTTTTTTTLIWTDKTSSMINLQSCFKYTNINGCEQQQLHTSPRCLFLCIWHCSPLEIEEKHVVGLMRFRVMTIDSRIGRFLLINHVYTTAIMRFHLQAYFHYKRVLHIAHCL